MLWHNSTTDWFLPLRHTNKNHTVCNWYVNAKLVLETQIGVEQIGAQRREAAISRLTKSLAAGSKRRVEE